MHGDVFFSKNVVLFLFNIHRHIVIISLPETPHIHKIVHIQAFKAATGNFVFCILLVNEQEKDIYMYIRLHYGVILLKHFKNESHLPHKNMQLFFFFLIFVIQINPLGNIFSALLPFLLSFCFPTHFQMSSFSSAKIRVARNACKWEYLYVLKNWIYF